MREPQESEPSPSWRLKSLGFAQRLRDQQDKLLIVIAVSTISLGICTGGRFLGDPISLQQVRADSPITRTATPSPAPTPTESLCELIDAEFGDQQPREDGTDTRLLWQICRNPAWPDAPDPNDMLRRFEFGN